MTRVTVKTFAKLSIFMYTAIFIYSLTNYKSRILFSEPHFMFEDSNFFMISNGSQRCRLKHSELVNVDINLNRSLSLEDVAKANSDVELGGKWQPSDCEPWQRVMIIIPYRDRDYHLRVLLNRLHPMLQRQKIAYQIFLAVQAGEEPFAKGRLLNIAYLEAMKLNKHFDCFIMQDVDLLPETDKNIYVCDSQARHLSPAIDEQRYHPLFYHQYGGVIALSTANFQLVNGFANRYAGWGNEDDDLCARTIDAGLSLTRPPYHIGRYKMIRHMKSSRAENANTNFLQWRHYAKIDGLNNMSSLQYKILSITKTPLYTNITIDVGVPADPPNEDIPKEHWSWFLWFFVP